MRACSGAAARHYTRRAEILRKQPEHGAEPEAIAHHFTQAGLADLASEWGGKAGDQALRRSAFQEAICPPRQGNRDGGQSRLDNSSGEHRLGRSERATDAVARRLRQRPHGRARLCRAGNAPSRTQSRGQ